MTKRQITFFATNGFYDRPGRIRAFRRSPVRRRIRRDELFLTRDGQNLVTITDQVYDERSDRYQQQILVNLGNIEDEEDEGVE